MAYIEITPAMVAAAFNALVAGPAVTNIVETDDAVERAIRAALAAGEVRTEPAVPEPLTHVWVVTTDGNGDQESIRLRIGDPPTEIKGPPLHVTKVQVTKR